eukprot:1177150-Prorocentrum_minimum.AAC.2
MFGAFRNFWLATYLYGEERVAKAVVMAPAMKATGGDKQSGLLPAQHVSEGKLTFVVERLQLDNNRVMSLSVDKLGPAFVGLLRAIHTRGALVSAGHLEHLGHRASGFHHRKWHRNPASSGRPDVPGSQYSIVQSQHALKSLGVTFVCTCDMDINSTQCMRIMRVYTHA